MIKIPQNLMPNGLHCDNIVPKVIFLGKIMQSFDAANLLLKMLLRQMRDFSFQVLAKNSFLFGLFQNKEAASEVQDNNSYSLYCTLYSFCVYE